MKTAVRSFLMPALLMAAWAASTAAEPESTTVTQVAAVDWQALNPARGDQSPQAGTLWGDRNGSGPTGFLLKPVDGFRSPPHIHNVSYRGVVIRGLIHNDDAGAEEMWMPAGSFWTQPKGAAHITAATGTDTLAYIEIEEGPYLVRPVDQAFESGEEPVNVAPTNLVWLDASDIAWLTPEGAPEGVSVAFVWGEPRGDAARGALLQLRAGVTASIRGEGASLRGVVIAGTPEHAPAGTRKTVALDPGGFFSSTGPAAHRLSCPQEQRCQFYLRSEGRFQVGNGRK